jgi:hypothetical protein
MLEKERQSVGGMKKLFQKQAINEEWSQNKEGQILMGSAKRELAGTTSKGKIQVSTKGARVMGDGGKNGSPSQFPMGLDESYSSSGRSFTGPNLADVEKTIKKAQEDGALLKLTVSERQGTITTSWKRKYQDETVEQSESPLHNDW